MVFAIITGGGIKTRLNISRAIQESSLQVLRKDGIERMLRDYPEALPEFLAIMDRMSHPQGIARELNYNIELHPLYIAELQRVHSAKMMWTFVDAVVYRLDSSTQFKCYRAARNRHVQVIV